MIVDPERLVARAEQLRNQSEFLIDQASAETDPARAAHLCAEAREAVFVAFALMVVAELEDAVA